MKIRAILSTLAFGLSSASGGAHDLNADPIPAMPGLRLGAAVAVSALQAPQTWPAPRDRGVLGSGQTPSDRRGLHLEHATLEAGLRLTPVLGAHLAVGQHDRDPTHLEAARLEARRADARGVWRVSAGRDRVPLGRVITGAGHFDRFALPPLAKRAMLNDDWIDDGLNLRWQASAGTAVAGLLEADLGVWRARQFPGGPAGPAAPVLHLRTGWDDFQADVVGAWLAPEARGTVAASSSAGHSHSVPDCRSSLQGVVCFDGRSRLLGLSMQWTPHEVPLSAQFAWLTQREDGALYAREGDTRYTGDVQGTWLDLVWSTSAQWALALRVERLAARHRLDGPGAAQVAEAAALSPNMPLQRLSAAAVWVPQAAPASWRVSFEAGQERQDAARAHWLGLRLQWSTPELWAGRL